jgi:hypothetical protein
MAFRNRIQGRERDVREGTKYVREKYGRPGSSDRDGGRGREEETRRSNFFSTGTRVWLERYGARKGRREESGRSMRSRQR